MTTTYFAVLAIGKDTPGMVAALTGILCKTYSCNIEVSQMTIVGGHFATMLIASAKAPIDCRELEANLADDDSDVRRVYVSPIDADSFHPFSRSEPSYTIIARTSDRLGVLHEIATVLAEHEVNITAVSSGCSDEHNSVCVVTLDVELPSSMQATDLMTALRQSIPRDVDLDIEPMHSSP